MSTFNINTGHTLTGADIGARGICGLKEEVLTRQLGAEIDKELKNRGHKTHMCRVDHANTLSESLNKQVNLCNSINVDLNIVIHFNKCAGGYGSEVYTYQGKYLVEADRVLKELNKLGFKNRGIKNQSLALTRRTKDKTIYIEVCFIDSQQDVNILNKYGMSGIAKAIVNGVLGTNCNVVTTNNALKSNNSNWINLDGKVGICIGEGVRIRSSKSTANLNNVIGNLNKGDKVNLYRREGDWIHIYCKPHGGYVYSKYINF